MSHVMLVSVAMPVAVRISPGAVQPPSATSPIATVAKTKAEWRWRSMARSGAGRRTARGEERTQGNGRRL